MRQRIFMSMIMLLGISLCGCVPLIVGGAAAGYVASNDAADALVECGYPSAWNAAYNTINDMGKVTYFRESSGVLKGIVDNNSVKVRIISITAATQRIVVSARKSIAPAPKTAQKVFLAIFQKLK